MMTLKLRSLLGLDRREDREPAAWTLFLHGKRDFTVDIRGVSRHQTELHGIVSERPLATMRQSCIATLLFDESESEKGAIAVEVGGRRVGYLPRHVATQYGEWLQTWRLAGSSVRCRAVIVCRNCGEAAGARYSVRLDLEIPFKMTTVAF